MGPFDDPFLYLRFYYTRRALLFDLGELQGLSARDLLRITDVFVSHAHMDHFMGFERLLRLHLHRTRVLTLYGPAGFHGHLEGRLSGFSWNLTRDYPLAIVAYEGDGLTIRKAAFEARNGFRREDLDIRPWNGILLDEENFMVRSQVLDHGIPCLGFRFAEKFKVNIVSSELEKLGLVPGPWLSTFKDALIRGEPGHRVIRAAAADGTVLPMTLNDLAGVYRRSRGHVISYIVDVADTRDNEPGIIDLAQNADLLYIEAAFAHADGELARERRHLTASRAGALAARSGAGTVRLLHLSPRYQGAVDEIVADARMNAGSKVKIEPGWKGNT